MYVPEHFKQDNLASLHEAMGLWNFGALITTGADGLEVSHVPMLVEAAGGTFGTLHGHIARGNPQWKRYDKNTPALATFLGPHAYVTPTWYPSTQQTGKMVPTWNYAAVHAYGTLEFYDDAPRLQTLVTKLTDLHEAGRAPAWKVSDAPADYIQAMVKAIIGFTLTITRLEGKWKMSQNRDAADFEGVRRGLNTEGRADVVALMPKRD